MTTRLPDPARSAAVLIGSTYQPDVDQLLYRLQDLLLDTFEQLHVLVNPAEVVRTVALAAGAATDVPLVYCAGDVRSDLSGGTNLVLEDRLVPLDGLGEVFERIDQALLAADQPRPQRGDSRPADDEDEDEAEVEVEPRPEPENIEFGRRPAAAVAYQRDLMLGMFVLGGLFAAGALAAFLLLHNTLGLVLGIVAGVPALMFLLIGLGGLAVHRRDAEAVRIDWADVAIIGVLAPDDVLTLKPRPGVSVPLDADRLLIPDLRKLGDVGLAKIGKLGVRRTTIYAGLDRFAGDLVAHDKREWLARNDNLRPDLI